MNLGFLSVFLFFVFLSSTQISPTSATNEHIIASRVKRGLDKDNKSHRSLSDKLDAKFTGNKFYDKLARPVIHGGYHGVRYIKGGNPAELARAKDQLSKIGSGQQRTEYLKAHQNKKKP